MIEIPNFTIDKEIGHGGMATVYLAMQDMLDRKVALKVLLPNMMKDEKLRNNFLSEGKIIARLEHPNIVRIHDIGIHDETIFYMSMEYLSGGTLKEKMAEGKIPLHEATTILEEIAKGLAYAHDKGYIHRDIKPGNILFREDGSAVITDFGIAKLQDTSGELTQLGFTMGTVQYMSPEQATTTDLDSRTDIYSLGLVFFEMLTGKKAFKAESNIQAIHQHTTVAPPALPQEYAYLQDVLNKVLAKDPDARYQTVLEFVESVKNPPASAPVSNIDDEFPIDDDKTVIHKVSSSSSLNKNSPNASKNNNKSKVPILLGCLAVTGLIIFGIIKYTQNESHENSNEVEKIVKEVEQSKNLVNSENTEKSVKFEDKTSNEKERKAKLLAEKNLKIKEEQERQAKLLAEQNLKKEEEKKAKLLAEKNLRIKEEQERQAKLLEEENLKKEEEERQAKLLAEENLRIKEEQERHAKILAEENLKKEEEERQAKLLAEENLRKKEEQERQAKLLEEESLKKEEEERQAKLLAEENLKKKEESAAKEENQQKRKKAFEEGFAIKIAIESLKLHNQVRANDGQKPFVWSDDLAQIAQIWAEKLASSCQTYHRNVEVPFGENLLKTTSTSVSEVIKTWASEKEFYNYKKNKCQSGKECGNYTQIVWKGTTDLGCAVHACSDGEQQIWVCNYFPAGN